MPGIVLGLLFCWGMPPSLQAQDPAAKPGPPLYLGPGGELIAELFSHPDDWKETRARTAALLTTDLFLAKQPDAVLQGWFSQLRQWNLPLELEVGAVKEWAPAGKECFAKEKPIWDRIQRLGGNIASIAMDEPLVCTRFTLKTPMEDAARETVDYIEAVRKNEPGVKIGEIEGYPSIPLKDHLAWFDLLQKGLQERGLPPLDFYRLDVDWTSFVLAPERGGSWKEVKQLGQYCRDRKVPFSLIYWASGYPRLKKLNRASDSAWYNGVMAQGYSYATVDAVPDQVVVENWVGAPSRATPETSDFTFTRSALDLVRKVIQEQPAESASAATAPPLSPEEKEAQRVTQAKAHRQQVLEHMSTEMTRNLDLPYIDDGDEHHQLDLYTPPGDGPFPLIVAVHGGGWSAGDKEAVGTAFLGKFIPAGFAVASVEYRFTGTAPFPAQIEDCKAALQWLRGHAAQYHLEPNRVGVIGHSAGGHLVGLLGTTADPSAQVQAVVMWSGPSDMTRETGDWSPRQQAMYSGKKSFLGTAYSDDLGKSASPLYQVHPGLPPFLIVHGAKDALVPPSQSVRFAAALQKAGVPATLVIDPALDHNVGADPTKTDDALKFFQGILLAK